MTDQIRPGRPAVKPKRKFTGFAINIPYIDKMQQLQFKLGEESLNDTYNRIIGEAFKKYKV